MKSVPTLQIGKFFHFMMSHSTDPSRQETHDYTHSEFDQSTEYLFKTRTLYSVQLTPVISNSLISNNRLSRSENLVPAETWTSNNRQKNIVEKGRNCSPLFHNIFNISLNSRVQLHIYLINVVVRIIFSSILQILYVEVRISRSI